MMQMVIPEAFFFRQKRAETQRTKFPGGSTLYDGDDIDMFDLRINNQ